MVFGWCKRVCAVLLQLVCMWKCVGFIYTRGLGTPKFCVDISIEDSLQTDVDVRRGCKKNNNNTRFACNTKVVLNECRSADVYCVNGGEGSSYF